MRYAVATRRRQSLRHREFERWLESERASKRGEAARAARLLADRFEAAGDYAAAVSAARQALRLAESDEPALRQVIALLDRVGDRAGALQAYETFAQRVRAEYGTDPSAETRQLIDQVTARHEPHDAAARSFVATAPNHAAVSSTHSGGPESTGGNRAHRRAVIIAAIAAGLLLVASGLAFTTRDRGSPNIRSIAVLPIEADSTESALGDRIQAGLIDELGRIHTLRTTGPASSMAYHGATKPPTTIAKELEVDGLLEGTLSVARGDSVLLHVRLRGGKRGDQIWAREYPTTQRQLERLQRQVARDVLDYLRVPLTQSERERLARGRVIDPRANEAYQRGLRMSAAFDPDRFQKSIDAFQEAIRLDPEDPAPYAALGEVYQTMVGPGHIGMSPVEAFRLAREAALRSLQLDSNYAEAHVVLAGVHYMWDWDWAGAEREFVRAIQSNPSSAKAHWQYGGYLRFHGWPDSAIAEQHRARRSDPLSTMILAELSLAYAYAGRSDSAIYWGRRAVDLEPNSAPVRYALGNAYMIAGQHDSAIFQERRAAELNPTFRTRLAEAYAAAGRVAQVDSLLATILEPRLRRVVELRTWLLRGDTDAVIRILERWVENHQPLVGYMRGGPEFEPLCSDPRYQALLKRLNLPPRVPRTKRPTWLAREPIRPSGR